MRKRLLDKEIADMREMHTKGRTIADLAVLYGTSASTAASVINRMGAYRDRDGNNKEGEINV